MSESIPQGRPSAEARARWVRARTRYNAALRLVRRAHLYAGLFMMPWVFLYGVTAFLFNHPGSFQARESVAVGPRTLAGTALADVPEPSALAARVVSGLNATGGRPTLRLARPESARFSRDLIATANDRGREHNVRIDLEARTGSVLVGPADRDPDGAGRVALKDPTRARLASGVAQVVNRLGLGAGSVSIKNPPELIFLAESGGKPWRVAYNLQTGLTDARPLEASRAAIGARRFLTGLHLARGYPARPDVRWLWAASVDAMAATMVFWGASGLLMWWQMKSTRRSGWIVLLASAAAATALAVGMRDMIAP